MKTIALIILCLTLNTAVGWAADIYDFHCVQEQIHLGDGSVEDIPVYVLLVPNSAVNGGISPAVFKTFDSKDMESYLGDLVARGVVARGSILLYEPMRAFSPSMIKYQPTELQKKALADYCKKIGITFMTAIFVTT